MHLTKIIMISLSLIFCWGYSEEVHDRAKYTRDDVDFLLRLEKCVKDVEESHNKKNEVIFSSLVYLKREIEIYFGMQLNIPETIQIMEKKLSPFGVFLKREQREYLKKNIDLAIFKLQNHAQYIAYIMNEHGYQFNAEEEEILFPIIEAKAKKKSKIKKLPELIHRDLCHPLSLIMSSIFLEKIPLTLGKVWSDRILQSGLTKALNYELLRKKKLEQQK